jgi:hypothetical protein
LSLLAAVDAQLQKDPIVLNGLSQDALTLQPSLEPGADRSSLHNALQEDQHQSTEDQLLNQSIELQLQLLKIAIAINNLFPDVDLTL